MVPHRPLIDRDDGFRRWQAIGQSNMRPFGVVVFPTFFDQDLCLAQAVEDLSV